MQIYIKIFWDAKIVEKTYQVYSQQKLLRYRVRISSQEPHPVLFLRLHRLKLHRDLLTPCHDLKKKIN